MEYRCLEDCLSPVSCNSAVWVPQVRLNLALARVLAVETGWAGGRAPLEWAGPVEIGAKPIEHAGRSRLGRSLNEVGGVFHVSCAGVLLGVRIRVDRPGEIRSTSGLLPALRKETAA